MPPNAVLPDFSGSDLKVAAPGLEECDGRYVCVVRWMRREDEIHAPSGLPERVRGSFARPYGTDGHYGEAHPTLKRGANKLCASGAITR